MLNRPEMADASTSPRSPTLIDVPVVQHLQNADGKIDVDSLYVLDLILFIVTVFFSKFFSSLQSFLALLST